MNNGNEVIRKPGHQDTGSEGIRRNKNPKWIRNLVSWYSDILACFRQALPGHLSI